jgi:hypothetical protein
MRDQWSRLTNRIWLSDDAEGRSRRETRRGMVAAGADSRTRCAGADATMR